MKRMVMPLPLNVSPPSPLVRFARSRTGFFLFGFFTAGLVAGFLSGLIS